MPYELRKHESVTEEIVTTKKDAKTQSGVEEILDEWTEYLVTITEERQVSVPGGDTRTVQHPTGSVTLKSEAEIEEKRSELDEGEGLEVEASRTMVRARVRLGTDNIVVNTWDAFGNGASYEILPTDGGFEWVDGRKPSAEHIREKAEEKAARVYGN